MSEQERAKKFVELANKRVPKALTAIRLIGNLGSYPFKPVHRDKIIDALKKAVEEVEYSFAKDKVKKVAGFGLDEEEF